MKDDSVIYGEIQRQDCELEELKKKCDIMEKRVVELQNGLQALLLEIMRERMDRK